MNKDLISRQAAIDAINTACDCVISFDGYSANEVASYFEDKILRVDAAAGKHRAARHPLDALIESVQGGK